MGGQHTDTPAPAPARASSPRDEETRPGLSSWETGCPQSLVQRAAAPPGPAGHARPLRACAHCTLLCQALQGEAVSLHGTSVELQPSTAPAPAPGSGASPTAPSCSAAPAAAPEFAQQRSPRPAALPLPGPARPPGLSCPSSAATGRGAPSQAPLRTAPAASTSANPGSCRPRALSTEPAATPSVAPAPARSVRQAPGLPVRRALLLCCLPAAAALGSGLGHEASVPCAQTPGSPGLLVLGDTWARTQHALGSGTHPKFVPRLRAGQRRPRARGGAGACVRPAVPLRGVLRAARGVHLRGHPLQAHRPGTGHRGGQVSARWGGLQRGRGALLSAPSSCSQRHACPVLWGLQWEGAHGGPRCSRSPAGA